MCCSEKWYGNAHERWSAKEFAERNRSIEEEYFNPEYYNQEDENFNQFLDLVEADERHYSEFRLERLKRLAS